MYDRYDGEKIDSMREKNGRHFIILIYHYYYSFLFYFAYACVPLGFDTRKKSKEAQVLHGDIIVPGHTLK